MRFEEYVIILFGPDICLSLGFISAHVNCYEVVFCLMLKIYRQPLKNHTSRNKP